ncbi:hypothetical protein EMIT093MI4_90043 [Pseudomonas sp. IT-93MI4]
MSCQQGYWVYCEGCANFSKDNKSF